MIVYKKMVQSVVPEEWCAYPDKHLNVKIWYSGDLKCPVAHKPWCIFSVWGCDDIGMEINEYVNGDDEANLLIGKWLDIYHDMPKHLTKEWLKDNGFVNA